MKPFDGHYVDRCTCGGFFGADDNCPSHGQSRSTNTPSISEMLRLVRELQPPKTVDVYLFTIAEHRELMANGTPQGIFPNISFCGIPFEVYPTKDEVFRRAFYLISEGKRVGLIDDQNILRETKP